MSIADSVEMTLLWPATAREAAPAALRTRSCRAASDASVDSPSGAFPIPTTTIRSAVTNPAPGMVVTEPGLPVAPARAAACTAEAKAASSASGPSGPCRAATTTASALAVSGEAVESVSRVMAGGWSFVEEEVGSVSLEGGCGTGRSAMVELPAAR